MWRVLLCAAIAAASTARAQSPTSIQELASCINERLANQGNVDMSKAVERCMPQGCKVTASMSTASAQPAWVVGGIQLPRVYLNCPGPGPGLRFRPTFTLCPSDANRIETGEDVAPVRPSPAVPLMMSNIDVPMNQPMHELSGYLSTSNNNLRCTRCHGNASPAATGDTPLLSSPLDAFTVQRRFNKSADVSSFSTTSPDGGEFYAGGTSIGVRSTTSAPPEPPTPPVPPQEIQ
jgi:hypothetical protein